MKNQMPYPVTDRQTPDAGEVFFDHVAWMVKDMDEASGVFERLGFKLTPYSEHGNRDPETGKRIPQGTANRLAMLESGYLELLCGVEGVEAPVVHDLQARIGRYQGVHLLAFSDADADAAYQRITASGFRLQPMVHLRRDVEAADGSEAEVQFSVVRAAFDEIPEGRIQVLTHHTPDLMWQDRYLARDNAITGLVDAVVCVDVPEISAQQMSEFLGKAALRRDADDDAVVCDRGGLRFVTRASLAVLITGFSPSTLPYTAAIGFSSSDINKTRAFFKSQGLRLIETEAALIVHPDDALGTALMVYK